MPYYPRVSASGDTFDAIVDSHWAEAIHVSQGHLSAQAAQDAAAATARGLNLRDYEQLVNAGFTPDDLPADLDPDTPAVEPLELDSAST